MRKFPVFGFLSGFFFLESEWETFSYFHVHSMSRLEFGIQGTGADRRNYISGNRRIFL